MKKLIVSILICLSIFSNYVIPTMASANVGDIGTIKMAFSSTSHIELSYFPSYASSSTTNEKSFLIKQYEGTQIIQEVRGQVGGSTIQITDYKNGNIVGEKTRAVSGIITKTSENASNKLFVGAVTADYGNVIGKIVYNKAYGSNEEKVLSVYSKITKNDSESYRINGTATDTLSIIVGAAVSIGLGAIPGINLLELVGAIITSLGGSIAGGAIGIIFSESVSVIATYYTLRGYYAPTKYYSPGYDGVARFVTTRKSSSYNKWLYEGFTPQNWKDGDSLANFLWLGTFGGTYPYVKKYVQY